SSAGVVAGAPRAMLDISDSLNFIFIFCLVALFPSRKATGNKTSIQTVQRLYSERDKEMPQSWRADCRTSVQFLGAVQQ
ncbi:hypothetical protein, partial [Elstera litoralis]|uniref:hypothetical protein n=1 Tax=Elstera litoralis TaxID=552518 RepID=UPI001E59148C